MPDASVPGIRDSWTGADTAQNSWMRSANRDNAYNPFIVNADGNVNNNNAYNGNRAAPDCNGHGGMDQWGAGRGAAWRGPPQTPAQGVPVQCPRGPNTAAATAPPPMDVLGLQAPSTPCRSSASGRPWSDAAWE